MSIDLLRKLGVYVDPNFLAGELCDTICLEIERAAKSDTPVYSEQAMSNSMNAALRKSYYADVPDGIQQLVEGKVKSLQPELERHFREKFHPEIYEAPKFVLYEPGHYFAAHRDSQLHRRINISVYLNDEKAEGLEEGYSGGKLTLYELFSNPSLAQKGVAVAGRKGLLVAYPAKIPHEVTPVIDGKRFAVVARFLDQDA